MYDTYLYHYGVKGMRWGVRRNIHRSTIASKNKPSVRDMSNEELNQRINRLQKERLYKDLTASPAAKVGKRIMQGIIVASAIEVSKNYISGHMKEFVTAGEEVIKKILSK